MKYRLRKACLHMAQWSCTCAAGFVPPGGRLALMPYAGKESVLSRPIRVATKIAIMSACIHALCLATSCTALHADVHECVREGAI